MDPEERRVKRSYRTLVSRNEKLYMGVGTCSVWAAQLDPDGTSQRSVKH
jgi:hypothetical protein